jgi:hypothetical protein
MLTNRLVGTLLRGAAVVALGAGSAAVIGAAPASATAFGCGAYSTSTTTAYAYCSDGTGIGSDSYRIALTCRHQGSNYSAYGSWVYPTQRSTKTCPYGSIFSKSVQKG